MIAALIRLCTRRPARVLLLAGIFALAGEWARRTVATDALPDPSDPQVIISARWSGRSPLAMRTQVTNPIERALLGGTGIKSVRGVTMAGIAFVHVLLDEDKSVEEARAWIAEGLERVRTRLPAGAETTIGPDASSVGWVFQYALVDRFRRTTVAERRRIQEALLAPGLAALPNVAEVATVGSLQTALNVELDLGALVRSKISIADAATAARRSLAQVDGQAFDLGGREVYLRSAGSAAITLLKHAPLGPPSRALKLGDVAQIWPGVRMTMGAADLDGTLDAVAGIVVARRGADVPAVIAATKARLAALASALSPSVEVVTTYDRSALIARTQQTLWTALAEEAVVVALVMLLFLGRGPSAAAPLVELPLVVLVTFGVMRILGIGANVMSLGGIAIAIGLCIDAEIVTIESCHVALAAAPTGLSKSERLRLLGDTAARVVPALLVALLIAAASFLPMFALRGEAGRLVRPLAITKTAVVLAGAAVTLTVGPALRAYLLRRVDVCAGTRLSGFIERLYRPFAYVALERPALTALIGLLAIVSTIGPVRRLGTEFMPSLDEGDLLYMPTTFPGVSMHEATAQLARQDRQLSAIPEVQTVFGKVGRADTATDPAPPSMAETTITLRPRKEWPRLDQPRWYSSWAPSPLRPLLATLWPERRTLTQTELVAKLERDIGLVGWTNSFTMPIRGRVEMLSTGVRGPVGLKIAAADLASLERIGASLERVLGRVPGTRRVFFDRSQGNAVIDAAPNGQTLAACSVDATAMRETLDIALAGLEVGTVLERGEHVPVMVRTSGGHGYLARLAALPLWCPSEPAGQKTLGQLVTLSVGEGPSMIRTEDGGLVGYVHVDLTADREALAYVHDARAAVERAKASGALALPPHARLEWTGQHEVAARTRSRMVIVLPLALAFVALLLYVLFRSVAETLIVLATVPFAMVGAVWSLHLLDYRLSAAVWVGTVALIGLAIQTGIVMMLYLDEAYRRRFDAGEIRTRSDVVAAHLEGAVGRLRPKLMTVATMALALGPLLLGDGAGAEVMKRVAAPMLGGLFTSAFLTLEILPVLATSWRARQLSVTRKDVAGR